MGSYYSQNYREYGWYGVLLFTKSPWIWLCKHTTNQTSGLENMVSRSIVIKPVQHFMHPMLTWHVNKTTPKSPAKNKGCDFIPQKSHVSMSRGIGSTSFFCTNGQKFTANYMWLCELFFVGNIKFRYGSHEPLNIMDSWCRKNML